MREVVYNLYLLINKGAVTNLGYILYEQDGTDEEKNAFLKMAAIRDYRKSTTTKAPPDLTLDKYNSMCRLGTHLRLFEYVFEEHQPARPLSIITCVVDGEIKINYETSYAPLDMDDVQKKTGAVGRMEDWLVKYTEGNNFHFTQLINDDFIIAYRLLFNNRLYASAAKLLVSCIDSLAHVEYGYEKTRAEQPVFRRWLDTYVDLASVSITSDELWELRNGLLHMSNLSSTKVEKKLTRRISLSIGHVPTEQQSDGDDTYYFDLHSLYLAVCEGICKWLETYAEDYYKFEVFVERWDKTISDSRLAFHYT